MIENLFSFTGPAPTVKNSAYRPHGIFKDSIWFSKLTGKGFLLSLKNQNKPIIMVMCFVLLGAGSTFSAKFSFL
jgi:hypothetical protein